MTAMPTILIALAGVLFVFGLFYIYIDLKAKYDGSLRYFGFSIIALSLAGSLEVGMLTGEVILYPGWLRLSHVLYSVFLLTTFLYLDRLTGHGPSPLSRTAVLLCTCAIVLYFLPNTIHVEGGSVRTGVVYSIAIVPILFISATLILWRGVEAIRSPECGSRAICAALALGCLFVYAGALYDLASIVVFSASRTLPWTLAGLLMYGLCGTIVLWGRLALFLGNRVRPPVLSHFPQHGKDSEARRRGSLVFISYGRPDEHFAVKLARELNRRQFETWVFAQDSMPGAKLYRCLSDQINTCSRVVLVCSKASLSRKGVLYEIQETLQREAREGGTEILVPITIDEHVYSNWAPDRAIVQTVRDRVIGDFQEALASKVVFGEATTRLAAALRRET